MRERVPLLAGLTLLAVAVAVGAFALADGIRDRDGGDDVLTVTGSARERITSDYVTWNLAVTSQRPTAAAAASELAGWARQVRAFLTSEGVEAEELTLQPIFTETLTDEDGAVFAYRLTRSFDVRSGRVDAIAAVAEGSSRLLARGIPLAAQPLQYVFTKLPELRPRLLAEATKDAQNRARVLAEATGADLGTLRGVDVGVFQVTSPNSTEVSDYGVYDTSTLEKDVTAVVNVTFAVRS